MDRRTLIGKFDAAVQNFADRDFLFYQDRWFTYRQVDILSRKVVSLLAENGIAAGDKVFVAIPNCIEFPVLLYGILRAGATIVPVNPLLKGRELVQLFEHSTAKIAFLAPNAASEFRQARPMLESSRLFVVQGSIEGVTEFGSQLDAAGLAEAWPGACSADTAAFLYTSGTTGAPKAAMLSQSALAAAAEAWIDKLELTSADRQIALLPLFHSFGFVVVLNATMSAGGSVVIIPRFIPDEALDAVRHHEVTILAAVTTMFSALLTSAEQCDPVPQFPALRLAGGAAAAIPPEIIARSVALFDCPMAQGYGLTECCTAASMSAPARSIEHGEIGTAMFNCEIKIIDETGADQTDGIQGELLMRGPILMSGYFNNPEATAAAIDNEGWLHTGDLAVRGADGRLFFKDRKKELIIRGGYNISPGEIEAILYEHPNVKTAAVIGIPHPALGEEVVALVVRRNVEPLDTTTLRDFVKDRVAPYKYPRHVIEMETLPLAPSGKVIKKDIDRTVVMQACGESS